MSIASGFRPRLSRACEYARLSRRARDWPALAVLGLARYRDFGQPDLLSRIGRRLFPVVKVRTDHLGHLAVVLDPTNATHVTIFDEVVIEDVYDLQKVPFSPDLILDCGGHIGLFTARAAARYPSARIIAFEPMPRNADMIRLMVRENAIQVEVRQEAVSDRTYVTQFHERMSYGGSLTGDDPGVVASYDVAVTDLISLVRAAGPRRLLLKVDVEGEEENLLPKLAHHLPPQTAVFFETHGGDRAWNRISGAFVDAGFTTQMLRGRDRFIDGLALRVTDGGIGS